MFEDALFDAGARKKAKRRWLTFPVSILFLFGRRSVGESGKDPLGKRPFPCSMQSLWRSTEPSPRHCEECST